MKRTNSKRKKAQRVEDDRLIQIWNNFSKKKYVPKDLEIRISSVASLAGVSADRIRQMLERRQKSRYDKWHDYNPPAFGRDNPFKLLLGDFF